MKIIVTKENDDGSSTTWEFTDPKVNQAELHYNIGPGWRFMLNCLCDTSNMVKKERRPNDYPPVGTPSVPSP